MKTWRRLSAVVLAIFTIAALTGTALAAEPVTTAAPAINVQMNGQPLAFSDAQPEALNGRTFVPIYAVTEALGAEVSYAPETKTVTIQRDGANLSMVLGENKATVVEGEQTQTIQMDVEPYAKNNRTYVPLAFVADALGCGVGWDQSTRTVVIVDVDALLGEATFDLMDNFAAYCEKREAGQNMTLDGSLTVDMTDRSGELLTAPLTIKGSMEGVVGEKELQLAGKIDGAALYVMFGSALGGPVDTAAMKALPEVSAELRADLEAKTLYASIPSLATGETAWYSVDLGAYEARLLAGLDMAKLTQMKQAGIRDILAEVIRSMPLTDSQYSYAGVAQVVEIYTQMLSDQAFTQKGNTYVAQMKLEDIMDMTVTLTKKGEDIVAADIKATVDVDEDGERASFTMTEHAAPDKVTVDMDMSLESADMAVKFSVDVSCVPTSKTPVTTLPAGVQAIPVG